MEKKWKLSETNGLLPFDQAHFNLSILVNGTLQQIMLMGYFPEISKEMALKEIVQNVVDSGKFLQENYPEVYNEAMN